jgi:hypothetical protein
MIAATTRLIVRRPVVPSVRRFLQPRFFSATPPIPIVKPTETKAPPPPPPERRLVYEFGRASASRELNSWTRGWVVSGVILSLFGFPEVVGVVGLVMYARELRSRVQRLVVYEADSKQLRVSATTTRLFGRVVVHDAPLHAILPAPAPAIGTLGNERGWSFRVPSYTRPLRCDWQGHVRNVGELNRLLGYDVRATVAEHERDQVHLSTDASSSPKQN